MKTKHHGAIGFAGFLVCFIGILAYGVYLAQDMHGRIHITSPPDMASKIQVPDPGTMTYISFLLQHMESLSKLSGSRSEVDLVLFQAPVQNKVQAPVSPLKSRVRLEPEVSKSVTDEKSHEKTGNTRADKLKSMNEPVFSYKATLALISHRSKLCVIDAGVFKEGDILDDGTKILKIENDRIMLMKQDKKKWISINN